MSSEEKKADSKGTGRIRLHAHFYAAGVLLLLATVGFNYFLENINRVKAAGESVPLKQPLASVPKVLGDWEMVEEKRLSAEEEYVAGVNDYINRFYVRNGGVGSVGAEEELEAALHLYVAYFGGIRVRAPHSPDICMRGSGWTIAEAHRRTIDLDVMGRTEQIGVNVHVFMREHEKRMVVWWDYIHGKNVTNPLMERIRWVLPLFLGGRTGSVVQVQIGKDIQPGEEQDAVYEMIEEFGKRLAPEVGKCLPEAR